MADLDPFDLVRRLRHAPLEPLVDALRRIHDRGQVDLNNLEALLGSHPAAPAAPLVDALRRIHDRGQVDVDNLEALRASRPAAPRQPSRTARPTSTDYEAARRHFVRHSERLREQAILAERLLDGWAGQVNQPPVVLQQELRVQCAPGATSGARFVVVNCLERTVDVRFRPGHVHGVSAEQATSIHLSFTPEQPRLEPGAEREVQLLVEVDGGDGLPDVLELGVDISGNEQMLLKLWVRIELRPGGAQWTNAT